MDVNTFVKSHGLGNDYVVLNEDNISFTLTEKSILRICSVNYGIGSDGILLKTKSQKADFGLRIFNPDGSEAEKSGNGLRIFCKYLYDYGFTDKTEFSVETKGGIVNAKIINTMNNRAKLISVEMGKATFTTDEKLKVKDKVYEVNCVSVGNPHCVILKDELNIEEIKKYGSFIENHTKFPNRINVQFAKVISKSEVEILIWERGAGFTLASGSSACAVASVLRKKNLIDNAVDVKMIGGTLKVTVGDNWNVVMTGEARQIAEGIINSELIEDLNNL